MRICSIFGVLIRHATVIENELSQLGIANLLIDLIEKHDKLKRRAISALGEYLFYGATQMDEDANSNVKINKFFKITYRFFSKNKYLN